MITSYRFGYIVVDEKSYVNDIIIFPDRVNGKWWRKQGHQLQPGDVEAIVERKPKILIVGTGYHGFMKITADTIELLESIGVALVAQRTPEACETYNLLSKSKKNVAAALHLTC